MSAGHDVAKEVKIYLKVFTALAILTVVTVGVAEIEFTVGLAIAVALLVASVKATMVGLFFMHLKAERSFTYWTLVLTAFFFVVLLALPLWHYYDGNNSLLSSSSPPAKATTTTQDDSSSGDASSEAAEVTKPAEDLPPAPVNTGGPKTATFKGLVTLKGDPPKMRPLIQIKGNADCATLHDSLPVSQQVVVRDGGKLVNAFVYVTRGLEGQTFEKATEKKVFDQKACVYSPHALGLQVGQPLEIMNSDATLHNVHMFPKKNKEVNRGQPKQGMTFTQTFRRAEAKPFKVKCDVHPWMNAWIGVFDHPYYAVTGENGSFELPKIAAGTYTLTTWHEKLGQKNQQITIADGETKEVSFEYE